jgi:hypothetical protein
MGKLSPEYCEVALCKTITSAGFTAFVQRILTSSREGKVYDPTIFPWCKQFSQINSILRAS